MSEPDRLDADPGQRGGVVPERAVPERAELETAEPETAEPELAEPDGPAMARHQPLRPSWRCAGCGGQWPCPPRRQELIAAFGGSRILIALHLAPYFLQATEDHPSAQAAELHTRFLGWIRAVPKAS